MLTPALGNVTRKTAEAQTAAGQAALACALERYHLTKGNYPETLAALEPGLMAHMPHDVITGKRTFITARTMGSSCFIPWAGMRRTTVALRAKRCSTKGRGIGCGGATKGEKRKAKARKRKDGPARTREIAEGEVRSIIGSGRIIFPGRRTARAQLQSRLRLR